MLLADIGNTHFHIFNGETVEHLLYDDAIDKYKNRSLYYISVKHALEDSVTKIKTWQNISDSISIDNAYDTMGVDRKALCLSYNDGMFIDAGSAITVDIMEAGVYMGGYILPGVKAMLKSYKDISSALDVELDENISLTQLPRTTKGQISYGIIAAIKALIDKHSQKKQLYFTGGDGKFLSSFFEDAIYDEALVFRGMIKAIKDKKIC
ncbi:MAG: pantothenate kinase [Epsilonproteobacteria bacterium]|nr:MAG: pantothenate kinase [Campylobacterota bacterium]